MRHDRRIASLAVEVAALNAPSRDAAAAARDRVAEAIVARIDDDDTGPDPADAATVLADARARGVDVSPAAIAGMRRRLAAWLTGVEE